MMPRPTSGLRTAVAAVLAVSLLHLAAPVAHATTAPTLSVEQQAKKAAVIVRARLGQPASLTENNVTYLIYPLTVNETVAGDASTLPTYQDKPALYFLQGLSDLPNLQPEQEVIALLYRERLDSPIVGFNQGIYLVKDGKLSRLLPLNPNATTPTPDPNPLSEAQTDPTKFRDALRAAREQP